MNRRWVAGIILVVWGGALGWLGVRQLDRRGAPVVDDTRTISPSAAFYTVSLDARQLGFASTTVDTVPEGLIIDDRLVLELPTGDTVTRTDVRTLANLTNAMRLEHFQVAVGAPEGRFSMDATVEADTAVQLTIATDLAEYNDRLPLSGPVVLPNHIPVLLSSTGQLASGTELTVATLDPLTLARDSVRVAVGLDSVFMTTDSAVLDSTSGLWIGARVDTVRAWRVSQRGRGWQTDSWIDRLGRLVNARSGTGPDLQRTAFEIAFNNFRTRDSIEGRRVPGPIVPASIVAARVQPPPPGLPNRRFGVGGEDVGQLDLEGGRQTFDDGVVVIERESGGTLQPDYRLPAHDTVFQSYLDPVPPFTADDPFVQAQARQIVGGTRNPRTAAQRLVLWTRDEIADVVVPPLPTAAGILAARRGDVSDHVTLFVAMARAVGLPARAVAGLLHVGDTFYYHAWAEVYLGNAWVTADPTMGTVPASPEAIRLVTGSVGTPWEQLKRLGRIELHVLDAGA